MSDSIRNLSKRLRYYASLKVDRVESATSIVHTGESYTFAGEVIQVTHTAVRQLCTIAKIPGEFYMNRMTGEEQAMIFNRLFSELRDTEFMFRFSKQTLYGIVSSKYAVLDNVELVKILREIQKTDFRLRPVLSILEPDHTKIRLVPEGQWDNDIVPMVEFVNSEVGLGSLRLWAGVYRRICSNGLLSSIYETHSNWRHYGNGGIEIPDLTVVFNVAREYTSRLLDSQNRHIGLVEKVNLLEKIRVELGQKVADAFVEVANSRYRGAPDWFSVLNALTEASQRFAPFQRTRIEAYAGELLGSGAV